MAVERLKKKADFWKHLLVFVLFNGMFALVWAMTGRHFFWPIFVIGGWGIGLIAHGVDTYGHGTPSEEEISEEMARLRRG
jgi:vacuolar-type H+-ATPase subunit I/STV1